MSLLRSFSFGHVYGYAELPKDVLNLFDCLVDDPNKQIEYASEIISAGLQKRIRFDGSFNIDAYEATIRKNERLNKANKKKKEVFIDYSDNSDDFVDIAINGGIRADVASAKAVEKMKDAYEELLMEDSLKYAIETIKGLRDVLLIDAKLDIIRTIKQALKGVPESVKALKKLCEEYDVVAEQIELVLDSGYEFDMMFA